MMISHVKKFLDEYAPLIVECCKGTPIFPSVAIAQAAIESSWGRTADATLFGVKGAGKSLVTQEEINGKKFTVTDNFRAYDSKKDAVLDYIKLLTTLPRYKMATLAKTPQEQIGAIVKGGYCTDSEYTGMVKTIIHWLKLEEYDKARG